MTAMQAHIGSVNIDAVIRTFIEAVYRSLDINEVFQEIVTTLGIYLQADRCFISRFDESRSILLPPTKEYRSAQQIRSILDLGPEPWAVLTEQSRELGYFDHPIELDEIPEVSKSMQARLESSNVESGLICTIRFQKESLAMLFIQQIGKKRHWTATEKEMVSLAAMQAGIATHHANLYERMTRQFQRQEMINRLYHQAISGLKLEPFLQLALDLVCEALNAPYGKVLEKSANPQQTFQVLTLRGFAPHLKGRRLNSTEAPQAAYALQALSPVVVNNIDTETRFRPSPLHREYGLQSGICAIIYGDNGPFGVLEIDAPQTRIFYPEDVYLMESIAYLMGLVIERKKAESTVRAYQRRLERSNQELEQFATIASHDLKNPLRKISTFSTALEQHEGSRLSAEGIDYLHRIGRSADRLQAMITDLLTLSSLNRGELAGHIVDLNELIREVVSDLEQFRQEVGGHIEVGPLFRVIGDEFQLHQAFQNLIANGLKFHREHVPPVVQVEGRKISGGRCEITVRDNGIGFAMEYRDRIFQPFERLHDQGKYPGTGIGLAVVKKIVERHKGSIRVESAPGQGSRFIVTLPLT